MAQYIDKSAVVAEIEGRIEVYEKSGINFHLRISELKNILSFLDTLEVKEFVEYSPYDLDPIFEEMGIELSSRKADDFKNAFYKAVDNLLNERRTEK